MSSKDTLTMLAEKFKNAETNEEVDGITVMIDGKVKDVFESIINKTSEYHNYSELLSDAVFRGVNEIIKSLKK